MPFHKDLDTSEIHQIHDQEFADLSTALGYSYAASDVGKVVRIDDEGDFGQHYIVLGTEPTLAKIGHPILATLETTNATESTVFSLTTATDYNYTVHAVVVAGEENGGDNASYSRVATFDNDSGVLTQIGTTTSIWTHEADAGWDCDIDTDTLDIRVRVTGDGTNDVLWRAYVTLYVTKNGL